MPRGPGSPPLESETPDLLAAFLPAAVLFVSIPASLYVPNQSDLGHNLAPALPYFGLACAYLLLLAALRVFVAQPWRTKLAMTSFYVGLYLALSDVLVPVRIGELMSGRETPNEPLHAAGIEIALAAAVVVGAVKLPWRRVRRFGALFVPILVVSEGAVFATGLAPDTRLRVGNIHFNTVEKTAPSPKPLADRGNVYHVTLDAYRGSLFQESAEKLQLTEAFAGFTFFPRTHANYEMTRDSLPSYMTGTFYREGSSLKQWKESHRSAGLVTAIYGAGYEVSMYAPTSMWINENASHVTTYEDMLLRYKSLSSLSHQFSDLWALRVAPSFLRQEVYRDGSGIFTRLFVAEDRLAGGNAKIVASVELMRHLIDEEASRPDHGQYVYAHLHAPHPPAVMNRDCVFSTDSVDYEEQVLCTTKLMADLVSRLKELGRYERSTIIFQSDHGLRVKKPADPRLRDSEMPREIQASVDALNPQGMPAWAINSRTNALLLIKPPSHSGEPLRVSDHRIQLVDLPATAYDLLDLPIRAPQGISAFSPDFPETREIHLYVGFLQISEKGVMRSLREGQIHHLSFAQGRGWKIHRDIDVRWN